MAFGNGFEITKKLHNRLGGYFLMKNGKRVYLFIILLILISAATYIYVTMFMPSSKRVDHSTYYGVKDKQVAIIYNDGLQKASAIEQDKEVYLPYDWAVAILNDKLFWDSEENLLVYTLPEEIIYMDENYISDGKKAFIKSDNSAYVSASLIKKYTNVNLRSFTDSDIRKIYIYDNSVSLVSARLKKKSKLRSGETIKADIVADLDKEESVYILGSSVTDGDLTGKNKKWLKAYTDKGDWGYVKVSALENMDYVVNISEFVKPTYTSISFGEPVVLGWHQVSNMDANKNMESLVARTSGMNVISPTWFSLSDNEGNYTSYASRDYVTKAHEMGLQVWGLVDNLSKKVSTVKLLKKSSVRKLLIEKLINDAITYNLDGINLDFEGLNAEGAKYYIQFIRELSVYARKNKIILSIDNPSYAAYNKFYARDKQAEVADYIINMGYDEHYAGSDKGSVASISFVKSAIEDSLKEVPREKLINAVPVYTRLWKEEGGKLSSQALGIEASLKWVLENNLSTEWKEDIGQNYAELISSGESYYMWIEDEKSMELKMNLIKENSLAGVAVWRLGLEPGSIWSIIKY